MAHVVQLCLGTLTSVRSERIALTISPTLHRWGLRCNITSGTLWIESFWSVGEIAVAVIRSLGVLPHVTKRVIQRKNGQA